jgi:hypothetical protein
VELQTIVDALEFCNGNRNDAIDLLAEQNKLSRSEGNKNTERSQSPTASYEARSDPATSQKYITQGLSRLPFSWHRTQTPTLIPDPTQSPLSPGAELNKELLTLEHYQAQPPLPIPPLPLPLSSPQFSPLPSPQQKSPQRSPQQSHTPYTPPPPYSPATHHPPQPTPAAHAPEFPLRRAKTLQQLIIPASPQLSITPPAPYSSSTRRTPSPTSSSPSPALSLPTNAPTPPPVYPHYAHYQQTQATHTYQPLISPLSSQPSPQLLPPTLSLQSSPFQSPGTTSDYTATPTTPNTPSTPTSPTSPPLSPDSLSPRLHQYPQYRYAYQSAPTNHTLHHFEAYSPDSSDNSPCHSHSHPPFTSDMHGYGYANNSFTGFGNISPENSIENLRLVTQKPQSPLAFRIVGARRNTYYMDYVVEVITPELRWLVYRRYSNFSLLNAKLLKLGLADPTKNVMPPKQFSLPPLSPFAPSDDLVQKRIDGLGAFLNSLVGEQSQFFLAHPIGQTFLNPRISSSEHNKVVNSISNDNLQTKHITKSQ